MSMTEVLSPQQLTCRAALGSHLSSPHSPAILLVPLHQRKGSSLQPIGAPLPLAIALVVIALHPLCLSPLPLLVG